MLPATVLPSTWAPGLSASRALERADWPTRPTVRVHVSRHACTILVLYARGAPHDGMARVASSLGPACAA